MQGDIDSLSRRAAVLAEKAAERVKRCVPVCIQQRVSQSGLTYFANGQVLSFVAGVTETSFPVPRFEVVGNPSHLAAQADVEELVPVSEFLGPYAGVIEATEANPGGQRNWRSVNNQSHIPDCEGIKRIRDRHTDAVGTARPYRIKRSSRNVEWIGRKLHRGQVRAVI